MKKIHNKYFKKQVLYSAMSLVTATPLLVAGFFPFLIFGYGLSRLTLSSLKYRFSTEKLEDMNKFFENDDNINLNNFNELNKLIHTIPKFNESQKKNISNIYLNIKNFLDKNKNDESLKEFNNEFIKYKNFFQDILNIDNDYLNIKLKNGSSLVKKLDHISIKLNDGSRYEVNGLNNITITYSIGSRYQLINDDIFISLINGSSYSKVGNTYSEELSNGRKSNQYNSILSFNFIESVNSVLTNNFNININLQEHLKSYTDKKEDKIINTQVNTEINKTVLSKLKNIDKDKIVVDSTNVLNLLNEKFKDESTIIESINFIKDSSFLNLEDLNNLDLNNDKNSIYSSLINLYKTTDNYNIFSDETKKEYLILMNDSLSNIKLLVNEKNIFYEKHYLKNLKIINQTVKYNNK